MGFLSNIGLVPGAPASNRLAGMYDRGPGLASLINPPRTDPGGEEDRQKLMDMQRETYRRFLAPPPEETPPEETPPGETPPGETPPGEPYPPWTPGEPFPYINPFNFTPRDYMSGMGGIGGIGGLGGNYGISPGEGAIDLQPIRGYELPEGYMGGRRGTPDVTGLPRDPDLRQVFPDVTGLPRDPDLRQVFPDVTGRPIDPDVTGRPIDPASLYSDPNMGGGLGNPDWRGLPQPRLTNNPPPSMPAISGRLMEDRRVAPEISQFDPSQLQNRLAELDGITQPQFDPSEIMSRLGALGQYGFAPIDPNIGQPPPEIQRPSPKIRGRESGRGGRKRPMNLGGIVSSFPLKYP